MKPFAWLIALGTFSLPFSANAFHAGPDFSSPVFDGGSGGLFYLGTQKERGWTCGMCHVDAPGKIRLRVSSDPSELVNEQRYVPGTRYTLSIAIVFEGAELGSGNPQSNYNALGMTVVDDAGAPLGSASGSADKFVTVQFSTLFTTGTNPRETSWGVAWTAPPETGHGNANLHLGVVDGNAGGKTGETFTDPFGDDVVMAHFVLTESGGAQAQTTLGPQLRSASAELNETPSPSAIGLGALTALALMLPTLSRLRPGAGRPKPGSIR